MIQCFKDDEAQTIYNTGRSKKYGSLARVIARRLGAIDFATSLEDLRDPPGNRLEALKGDRKGQYSIRINDRYRVCFRWQITMPGTWKLWIITRRWDHAAADDKRQIGSDSSG